MSCLSEKRNPLNGYRVLEYNKKQDVNLKETGWCPLQSRAKSYKSGPCRYSKYKQKVLICIGK